MSWTGLDWTGHPSLYEGQLRRGELRNGVERQLFRAILVDFLRIVPNSILGPVDERVVYDAPIRKLEPQLDANVRVATDGAPAVRLNLGCQLNVAAIIGQHLRAAATLATKPRLFLK